MAQQVKDLALVLSKLWLGLLLWHGFNSWPWDFCTLQVQPKKKERERERKDASIVAETLGTIGIIYV